MVYENRYAVPTGEQLKVMISDKLNVTAHSEIKISIYVTIRPKLPNLKDLQIVLSNFMHVTYRLF